MEQDAQLAARAARFGGAKPAGAAAGGGAAGAAAPAKSIGKVDIQAVHPDRIKARQERFGKVA